VPQFYDTLDEARSVLRLVKAVFPGPFVYQSEIFAMRDTQWIIIRDMELVERGNLIDVWLQPTAA